MVSVTMKMVTKMMMVMVMQAFMQSQVWGGGGHRVQEDASGICEPCPGIYTPSNIFATDANGET